MRILVPIIIALFCVNGWAEPPKPNKEFNKLMNKLLDVDASKGEEFSSMGKSTIFKQGYSLALKELIDKKTWTVSRVFGFEGDIGFMPLTKAHVQVAQAPVRTEQLCINCFYGLSKKSGTRVLRVVASINGQYVSTFHKAPKVNDDPSTHIGLNSAFEFLADMNKEVAGGLVYKNGVLEFDGSLGFLQGVDDYKFQWNEFIFPDFARKRLQTTIDGFINDYNQEEWEKYGLPLNRGVLLYGPPGTGKSFIAKVLASNILKKRYKQKISYIHVSARHIGYAAAVRNLYQAARWLAPAVVFIEDIDLIAGTDRTDRADVKNELMQQLSGLEALKGVLTIGTTNVGDKIDPALKRSKRLGFHFEVGLPKQTERVQLLQLFLRKFIASDVVVDSLASQLEGYTGADIKELVDVASQLAIEDKSFDPATKKVTLTSNHIKSAVSFKKKHREIVGGVQ